MNENVYLLILYLITDNASISRMQFNVIASLPMSKLSSKKSIRSLYFIFYLTFSKIAIND